MNWHAELLTALAALAWPLLAVVVLVTLRGPLRSIIESRAFTVELGGMKVSVGSSIDQINKDLAELKAKFAELETGHETAFKQTEPEAGENASAGESTAVTPDRTKSARILWVDDKPEGNALAIAQLQSLGIRIDLAPSTEEAMQSIDANSDYAIIISDIGRTERGIYQRKAGLELLRRLRELGETVPVVFFTTHRTAQLKPIRDAVMADRNASATGSTTELFSLINKVLQSRTANSGVSR